MYTILGWICHADCICLILISKSVHSVVDVDVDVGGDVVVDVDVGGDVVVDVDVDVD